MRLEDEDSDEDFDGYFQCDMDEPCWRGSDDVASLLEQRTQASDNSGDGESDDGHMSVEGSRSDVDGHMSVDGASGSRSDIDGRSRSTGRVEGGRGSRRGSRGRGRGRGRSRGRGRGHSAFVSGSTSSDSDGPHASRGRSRGRGSRGSHRDAGNQQDRHGERIIPTIPTFSGSPGCTRDMTDKSPVDTMSKGDIQSLSKDGLLAVKWMDKRQVTMISTIHDDSMAPVQRRSRFADGGREVVEKPKCILEYNRHMGGVDLSDQLTSYHSFAHRTVKWWQRVFFHLIDTTIVNAYIFYKESTQSTRKLTHVNFRVELALLLL